MIYQAVHGEDRLKIETSLRDSPDESQITFIDGIRVYQVAAIVSQKIAALLNRTAARDLHDVHFLLQNHGSEFSRQDIEALSTFTSSIDDIQSRFLPAYEEDYLLSLENFDETVLELFESVAEHKKLFQSIKL